MLGQLGGRIHRSAAGLVDDQAARVQVHLAADRPGEEGILPTIFSVAHDRMAHRRAVDAQLVGAPGQRL